MNSQDIDVIVVGAGFAGLKVATELKQAGKQVLVLEARDRVGGRSKPGELCGQTIDLGGQWVGPTQTVLLDQAKALGVKTYPQYAKGNNLLWLDNKVSHYTGNTPKLPLLTLLELGLLDLRWKRQIGSLNPDAPWAGEQAKRFDAQSVESWLQTNIKTRSGQEFMRVITRALLCAEPAQVSYLCLLEYMRQAGGIEALINTEDGAQQDKFVGGAWQISKLLADELGESVKLNSPVLSVEQGSSGVKVATAQATYSARHLVIATPPSLSANINFTAPLPSRKWGLLQRMPMGAVIKVHVAYAKPFWRKAGFSGSVISNRHHFNVVFDQSPENESMGMLVGFLDGAHAVELGARTPQERQHIVLSELVEYFGEEAKHAMGYIDQDWTQEPWSLGGYVAHMPPGVMTQYGASLREVTGRIHWAGTETATQWCGYLDGALSSGIRAAKEVVQAQG